MSEYCIDSSIWIAYAQGASEQIRKTIEEGTIVTSSLSLLEVADAYTRQKKTQDDVQEMLAFMASKSTIIQLNSEISSEAARIKERQRKKSPKFGIADGAHLATARYTGTLLLTTDNDFRGMKDAKILSSGVE